jgi:hypothetical protein
VDWALPFLDAYRKADYVRARTFIPKADMPGQFFSQALFAAVYGQLEERPAAEDSVRQLLALKPDFPQIARDEFPLLPPCRATRDTSVKGTLALTR